MKILKIFSVLILVSLFLGCTHEKNEIIIYCALDRIYAEPILQDFEEESGINVKAVYDTELTKTVGLVNRIIAESSHPQCDIFWNNEISRTIFLKNKNLLTPYISANSSDIPAEYKDAQGFWTGFAARARIIIYNKDKFLNKKLPTSIFDLIDPRWKGKAAMAYPLFGTTATHASAIFEIMGTDSALIFFNKIKENEICILDGNATVRDRVVAGEFWWGFTDTDDANGAIEDNKNVGIVYPDQLANELGTLVIPNTLAIIKNGPNPEKARILVDYILSLETEEILAKARSAQIPLRNIKNIPDKVMDLNKHKLMDVDFDKVSENMESTARYLQEIFVR
jgi:iron(III) transport system substrate-binding protein